MMNCFFLLVIFIKLLEKHIIKMQDINYNECEKDLSILDSYEVNKKLNINESNYQFYIEIIKIFSKIK